MNEDKKVRVINNADCEVGVILASRNFQRTFPPKGIINFPMEVLEEAIYDVGFKNAITQGILTIDDLEASKALGLEPDDAEEPVNIIRFDTDKLKALLEEADSVEFEEALKIMPSEFKMQLAQMAITASFRDGKKIALIKKYQGVDVRKGIELAQED